MSSHSATDVFTSRQHRSFFLLSKASPIITVSLLALIASSCTPIKVHLDEAGYVIGQDNYAFAIYTGDGNLLTHPLEHFHQRQSAQPDRPFSDVYVISHGWNFTIPEAIANYHAYIEIFDQQMKRHAFGTEFRPFFIFVVWNSVTRPLTDSTRAILPYELDASLGFITSIVDRFVFFLPSVWKQSVNASAIALGNGLSENSPYFSNLRRLRRHKGETASVFLSEDQLAPRYGVEETAMGSQYPVSALLLDLFRQEERSPRSFRIHVIGHSYGAKIAALSSIGAIDLWELEHSTHGGDETQFERRNEQAPQEILGTGGMPLDSLLLINPAMNPREFESALLFERQADTEHLLHFIPRKAVVYSNYDYPNGLYFDISQMVLNTSFMQSLQPYFAIVNARFSVIGKIASPFYAMLYSGGNVLSGIMTWACTRVINIPFDFSYHLKHNNTFPENSTPHLMALRYTFNAIHFFVPLDRLLIPGQPADQLRKV